MEDGRRRLGGDGCTNLGEGLEVIPLEGAVDPILRLAAVEPFDHLLGHLPDLPTVGVPEGGHDRFPAHAGAAKTKATNKAPNVTRNFCVLMSVPPFRSSLKLMTHHSVFVPIDVFSSLRSHSRFIC